MANGNPVSSWQVLSGMIRKKVADQRARKQAVEDQERDNEMSIIMSGVQAHAQNGTLTDDMIEQAQQKMQKLVPKDSLPIVQAWTKVIGHLHRKKQQGSQQGQGQGQAQGQAQGQTTPPSGRSVDPGMILRPADTNLPQTGPSRAPAALEQTDTGQSSSRPGMFPSASEKGQAAGQFQVAQDTQLRDYRMSAVSGLQKRYAAMGKKMSPEMENDLQMWAIGAPVTARLLRHRMHPVTVKGPNNTRIPGVQDLDTGEVTGPDGEVINNPEIMPSSGAKPRTGWGKDKQGFYSFAIDPYSNQPIPGTEDRTALPPSQYLDKTRTGFYYFTDDSGVVHEIPHTTKSGVSVPSAGTTSGAPAVPSNMRGPGKGKATGAPVAPGSKTIGRTVGSKDTGVLNPQAQKVITTTQPVLDQVDRLLGDIDRLNLGDNNTSGYLFSSRLKYSFGKASPEGSLANDIAGLSLGSVVEAASALQGSSRSMQALKKALVHTPNPWVDSPKLIKEKLSTIKDRLSDIVQDANQYGRKRQPSTAGPASVPGNLKSPVKAKTVDDEADEYLKTH